MKLAELAKQVRARAAAGPLDADARDVTHDSRDCAPGTVFVAIRGQAVDAHRFVPQAIERGAVAIISERDFEAGSTGAAGRAWLTVEDARVALAEAAAAVHGHPSRQLKLVGITGTNGKTTTAHLVDSIIRQAEGTSAILGTIHHRVADEAAAARHTTPEAPDIQRLLGRAAAAGCRSAVMEVSSHAIELSRVLGLMFEVAVFSNLTRDHLDYHRTMDSYFAAKRRLFDGSLGSDPRASVINIDDEYGRVLRGSAKGRVMTYGLNDRADVRAIDVRLGAGGLSFTAITPAGPIGITSTLVGRPHLYNSLAAVATAIALGFDPESAARGIAGCASVPGRFEEVTAPGSERTGFRVFVDYAHTDDALSNVLRTAREVAGDAGRVIVVFGCGGDRDRSKRAPMGEIAGLMSDIAIVTSDNPRTEDPDAIIDEIEVGLKASGRSYEREPDRRAAITRAIEKAREGDVVLIAGKGHETYQVIGERRTRFDDREVAREAIGRTVSRQGASLIR